MTILSPSWTIAIGPPSAASGATCPRTRPSSPEPRLGSDVSEHQPVGPAGEAAVRDERDIVTEALADERRCDAEHLLHAGSADRSFVADDDDVAWHDPAIPDRLEAFGLRIEDSGRPALAPAPPAGAAHDAPYRRQRS